MVKFHFLGGKCKNCKSYNTNRIDNPIEIEMYKQNKKKENGKAKK